MLIAHKVTNIFQVNYFFKTLFFQGTFFILTDGHGFPTTYTEILSVSMTALHGQKFFSECCGHNVA
jgi:hypothetical protein